MTFALLLFLGECRVGPNPEVLGLVLAQYSGVTPGCAEGVMCLGFQLGSRHALALPAVLPLRPKDWGEISITQEGTSLHLGFW